MGSDASLAARTEYWARRLTAIPSVTGTADEAAFADRLAGLLRETGTFGPDAVWTVDVPGGGHQRRCILALTRGEGRRTVVLTGHFDTVETGNYGALQPLALDPDRLREALIETIAAEPFDARSALARDDLAGGGFLPGRGLLDMKAGLAAGLAVAEAHFARPDRAGNLLFIAVPDEEGNSAGARRMAEVLASTAREHGLEIEAVINLDATTSGGDGADARVIAFGSVGKLLPSALVIGRPAHASESFRGFGASALAGALAAALEWLPELTERTGGELGSGPTLLGMKDVKQGYDVTTPDKVWMYWNVATHRRGPGEVLRTVQRVAGEAAGGFAAQLAARAKQIDVSVAANDVAVLTYRDLLDEIGARDAAYPARIEALARELAQGGLDLPEQCRRITEEAWRLSGRSGPAIVIGFASTPYLPVALGEGGAAQRLREASEAAAAHIGAAFGTSVSTIGYFPGISDMSFFGEGDASGVAAIAANTPAWMSVTAGGAFAVAGIPCINVGPWGRDYHTRLERLHIDYGFRILPALIQDIIRRLFAAG